MNTTIIKVGAIAAVLAFATGCESTTALQNQVDALQSKVAALETQVQAVDLEALEAAVIGIEAAEAAAAQSQACCDATNERIDRMFQQSQSK